MFQLNIKTKQICSSLKKKGFKPEESHHTFYWLYLDGQQTHIKTKISHGSGYEEYGDQLLSAMRKQLQLNSMGELQDLLMCPMSQEKYIRLLKERNKL